MTTTQGVCTSVGAVLGFVVAATLAYATNIRVDATVFFPVLATTTGFGYVMATIISR